jgi:hypothetical protein
MLSVAPVAARAWLLCGWSRLQPHHTTSVVLHFNIDLNLNLNLNLNRARARACARAGLVSNVFSAVLSCFAITSQL